MADESPPMAGNFKPGDFYFIEMYLRQLGNHNTLLDVDALVLRNDLAEVDKAAGLQTIIQGALNGQR